MPSISLRSPSLIALESVRRIGSFYPSSKISRCLLTMSGKYYASLEPDLIVGPTIDDLLLRMRFCVFCIKAGWLLKLPGL